MSDEITNSNILHHDQTHSDSQPPSTASMTRAISSERFNIKVDVIQLLNDMGWELHDKMRASDKSSRTDRVRFDTIMKVRNKIYEMDCWKEKSDEL